MSTLQNFGVPVDGVRGNVLMPKVSNRFRVIFENFANEQNCATLTQQVMSVNRPKLSFIGSTDGRQRQGITIKFRDDIKNYAASLIKIQMHNQLANNSKFKMIIETMDGSRDNVLEQWHCERCSFGILDYGNFDYSDSDIMIISAIVKSENISQRLAEKGQT